MTVSELINLLDTKENRYGGATGKEREISISVNNIFLGYIESAEMDGHGDGLVTDVSLCVHTDMEWEDISIRPKVDICREFAERLEAERTTLYMAPYDEDWDVKAVLWDDVEFVLAEMERE